jgi:hypothetical protein
LVPGLLWLDMKVSIGDLVYDKRTALPWLVVSIAKTKKTWWRRVTLYADGSLITIKSAQFALDFCKHIDNELDSNTKDKNDERG